MSPSSSRSDPRPTRLLAACAVVSACAHAGVIFTIHIGKPPAHEPTITLPTTTVERGEHAMRLAFVEPSPAREKDHEEATAVVRASVGVPDLLAAPAETVASDRPSPEVLPPAPLAVPEPANAAPKTVDVRATFAAIEEAWRYSEAWMSHQARRAFTEREQPERARTEREPERRAEPAPSSPAQERGASSPAELAGELSPRYPALSRRRGEQGLVVLRVRVLADGSVGAIEVLEEPGHPRLVEAAQEAVRRAAFTPAKTDGEAIDAWVRTPVRFVLE